MTVSRATNAGNVNVTLSETELRALEAFADAMMGGRIDGAELAPEHRAPLARIKAKAIKGLEILGADRAKRQNEAVLRSDDGDPSRKR